MSTILEFIDGCDEAMGVESGLDSVVLDESGAYLAARLPVAALAEKPSRSSRPETAPCGRKYGCGEPG